MSASAAIDTLMVAIKERKKDEIRAQWVAQLPFMSMKFIEYMPFEDYYDRMIGANIDRRSDEEIIAMVAEIRKDLE